MADKNVDMQGSNLFGLGANFHIQNSSSPHERDSSSILDASGNTECETMIRNRTSYDTDWSYCNATPNIATDLGTFLTKFGIVQDSKANMPQELLRGIIMIIMLMRGQLIILLMYQRQYQQEQGLAFLISV